VDGSRQNATPHAVHLNNWLPRPPLLMVHTVEVERPQLESCARAFAWFYEVAVSRTRENAENADKAPKCR